MCVRYTRCKGLPGIHAAKAYQIHIHVAMGCQIHMHVARGYLPRKPGTGGDWLQAPCASRAPAPFSRPRASGTFPNAQRLMGQWELQPRGAWRSRCRSRRMLVQVPGYLPEYFLNNKVRVPGYLFEKLQDHKVGVPRYLPEYFQNNYCRLEWYRYLLECE